MRVLAYLRDYPQLSEKGSKTLFPCPSTYLCKEAFKKEWIPVLYILWDVEEEGILLNSFYEIDPDIKTGREKN